MSIDVETLKTAAWTTLHAGDAIEKIIEITPVVGEILYLAANEKRAETILGGFYQGSDAFDFNDFIRPSHL